MVPYASFFYFAVAGLYVIAPTVVLRAFRRLTPSWIIHGCILVGTLAMLGLQYSNLLDEHTPALTRQLGVIAVYALAQYGLALALLRCRAFTRSKWPGHAAVALSVAPLLCAKLAPAALAPASPGGLAGLVEFIGLSYATLRAVDVLIGVHDGLITALPPGRFFAFLVFFPTISSGPVDRYRRFSTDWQRPMTRTDFWNDLDGAVHRVFTGFFYKFILAYLIKEHWLDRVPASPTLGHTLSYMYAYSAYLFFDFAGYSAFAIGFSYLFGIHVPENFNAPLLSRNIKEFWTRWHITLSYWFRDFVYMRFLLAAVKGKWFRNKYAASYTANFLTFGLMGFWHGTAPHFLIYGVYHACLVTGHDLFARWNRPRPDAPPRFWGDSRLAQTAAILLTAHAVCLGFLIFSGRQLWR